MTTRAEEIAAKEYPDLFIRDDKMKTSGTALISDAAQMLRREGFINGYKQGQQDRWISVEERLPEELPDGTNVLGWNCVRMEPVLATLRGGLPFDVWNEGWDHKNEITHWAPLPPNPEQR